MRLQELKADLDGFYGGDYVQQVARRVADLYQNCDQCDGNGYLVDYVGINCSRCGGTGAIASELALDQIASGQRRDHRWLARYLFGEDT